ncbi:MAG: hypothetical protein RIS21_1236 [Planctomycetota bacterium]|jgi:16S rRNA (uracil1498-N3)-methyltransferase
MALLRFFSAVPLTAGYVTLDPDEARHAVSVYRLRAGERITLIDGCGGIATATLSEVSPRRVVAESAPPRFEPRPTPCALWCALPRAGGADDLVRRVVEAGCTELRPIVAVRGVWKADDDREARRIERWNRLAIAALKQCGATWMPEWRPPVASSALPDTAGSVLLSASTGPGAVSVLAAAASIPKGVPTIALVGPEGGWTPEEESGFAAAGALAVTLGPSILRVETAATLFVGILRAR